MPDALLVGNNLAVLVAAAELGAAGRDVVLATDGRPPGGHFRGLRVADTDFDIGMVTLEQLGGGRPSDAGPGPADYRPDRRYDWTRFAGLVDRWQEAQAELRRTPTPEVRVEGRRWPDHLMSDRLDVLATLGEPPPAVLPREDPVHASQKTTGAAYERLTYAEAAAANHGTALQQRLVTPFARKVLGPALDDLLALYHRAAWVPLYWPETVTAACAGEPTAVAEHPFWTTSSGFVGEVVRGLERRVAAMPTVVVDPSPVEALTAVAGGWEARTAGGTWTHRQPVLGLAADRAAALLGAPVPPRSPGASVTVLCCTVRSAAVREPAACLLVADDDHTAYRVTDQDLMAGRDAEWRRVTVEAGHAADALAARDVDVAEVLTAELRALLGTDPDGGDSDVRVLRTLRAPGALAVPTATAVAAAREARAALQEACPPALLTGALLGPGLNSLGDQVVLALGVAERLG